MVQGFSATNGMTFSMQDRTGGDVNKFFDITQNFIAELNKRPEISNAMTSYNTKYPQYKIDVDVSKCKQSGIIGVHPRVVHGWYVRCLLS